MIILKSFFITAVISLLIAFGLKNIVGFWEAFSIAIAIQVVISFAYSSLKLTREQALIDQFEADMSEVLSMSTVTVECPCGKNTFEDVIFTGIENTFECDECGSKFRSDISITPTLITEPVNAVKPESIEVYNDLIKEKEH
tara:strand:+ start:42 stop:464 length:423 start_codon:yes stop_codon:yes gene_type:complete